jgi:hypothetical protein
MTNDPAELTRRAFELWPEHSFNQAEWLRAWRVLRSTERGALIEQPAHAPHTPTHEEPAHASPIL